MKWKYVNDYPMTLEFGQNLTCFEKNNKPQRPKKIKPQQQSF